MADKRTHVLRYLCVIVSMAAKFVSGTVLAFNLYQDAVKSTFNYTQTEVEIISSMLATGIGVSFIPGMMYDRYGSTITNLVGFIISVSAYLLLWSSVRFIRFYSSRAWIIAVYFFFAGFGSSFPYMVAFATALSSVSPKYTGIISCLQNAAFTSAPAINGLVYYNYFSTKFESANQLVFSSYMLYMAILIGIVDFLSIIFLRIYTDQEESINLSLTDSHLKLDTYQTTMNSKDSEDKLIDDKIEKDKLKYPYSSDNWSLKELLCNSDYQIFSCSFALTTAVFWTSFNNITALSKSVHLQIYNKELMITYSITNPIVCVLSGLLSDHFKHKVPRYGFVLIGCLLILICQIVSISLPFQVIGLFFIAFFISAFEGIVWSLSPVIVREMFSAQQVGRNWGINIFLSGVLTLAAQAVFGLFYDAHVPEGSDNNCYGIECTRSAYITFLVACVVAFIMETFLFVRIYRRIYRNNK